MLRAAVRAALPAHPGAWSWATLSVNAVGALLLGALLGLLARRPSERARLLLGTGLLGALTTFSGVTVEAVEMVRAGRPVLAAGYVTGSVVVLLAAAATGSRLVRR